MMILDMKKKPTSKGKFRKNISYTSISHILKKNILQKQNHQRREVPTSEVGKDQRRF